MKKSVNSLFVAFTIMAGAAFTSCSSSDDDSVNSSAKDTQLQTANVQFVSETVIPTYKTLADKSLELQEAMETLLTEDGKTQDNVDQACTLWKEARQYWEWSEAFLFGAASKYYIDPHIDTWPLDQTALNNLLNNDEMMSDIENVVANLNNGLVGFHGIEYIIFREGQNRSVSDMQEKELRYAVAVAKDLALSSCRLEAAWAGIDNITAEKKELIEEAEMEPEDNFGEQMTLAGQAGSVWKSVTAGSEQIIEGCRDIVDEVGQSKIGKPYYGEDINYIESPHAYNSIQDFKDNIESVKYAYYGGLGATSPKTNSLSAYVRSIDAETDQAVIDAINNCIAKIQAMRAPFVLYYQDSSVKDAIEACTALDNALAAAQKVITES